MNKNNKLNDHRFAHLLCKNFHDTDQSLCVITQDTKSAQELFNEVSLYLNKDEVMLFPENEMLPYDHFSTPENIIKLRFKALNNTNKVILISTVRTLYEKFPSKDYFKTLRTFSINDEISINIFLKVLESLNFERNDKVEKINQYAHRGGIVDFFTPIYKNPIRVEFFDTTIESIRFFDEISQSSLTTLDSFKLSNGSYIPLNETSIELFKQNWRDYFSKHDERNCEIFNKVSRGLYPEGLEIYLPFFFTETKSFKDIFNNYKFVNFYDDIGSYNNYINQRYEDENIDVNRPLISPRDLFGDHNEIIKFLDSNIEYETYQNTFSQPVNIEALIENPNEYLSKFKNIVLLSDIASELNEIKDELNFKCKDLTKKIDQLDSGIHLKKHPKVRPLAIKGEILVIHSDKYSDIENLDSNTTNNNLKEIIDFNPFKIGDLLIHEKYGLGQYEGLEVVKTDNLFNEYIKIKYANDERLYVPLRNINLLSKYHISLLSEDIEFDSISSNKWLKKKDKALKQAYDHAAEILDMESRRANSSSISLRISDNDFKKFNNEFPYTETSDQLIAVNSIRKDMELIKPMNRLLCGDVGFGKTEVAMRAAFISVFSEKQVIVLCPSTILAKQHYESFIERFNSFPVNIELLTRHVSLKNKEKIIASYNSANIDILISTHAIFNQNINYSNTGLLIVDEEHRFGIKQKDLIKSKQDNIHILYLSATPIPRTMNFVFSGLKDFSFLNTPPLNRLSIKSFLKISDDTILKESLSREIQRGGQCFVLQNNIERMDTLKSRILKILPDSKVGIAHGRLNKREISEVMQAFSSGQLDVLICTTIVEMGLDIPNANTMIIEDSHKLGLAQLHQIRGRIGRSNKQGYCYFLIPHNDIPKIASDRLDSIIRNSKLGSGYFIAQEDMELRGSGEILGDKQSGHISAIGLSLYLSMLKSAIKLNKDKTKTELIKTDVNFYDSAFISDSYMPSTVERLKIYKLVYEANSGEDIYKIKSHLQDTCGKIPVEVNNLLLNATINNLIGRLKISKLTSTSECTSLKLTKFITDELLMKLLDISKKDHDKYYFDNQNKFNIKLNEVDSSLRREKIIKFLNEII